MGHPAHGASNLSRCTKQQDPGPRPSLLTLPQRPPNTTPSPPNTVTETFSLAKGELRREVPARPSKVSLDFLLHLGYLTAYPSHGYYSPRNHYPPMSIQELINSLETIPRDLRSRPVHLIIPDFGEGGNTYPELDTIEDHPHEDHLLLYAAGSIC